MHWQYREKIKGAFLTFSGIKMWRATLAKSQTQEWAWLYEKTLLLLENLSSVSACAAQARLCQIFKVISIKMDQKRAGGGF